MACIIWDGTTVQGGYGKRTVNGKTVLAHRYAYEIAHGTIGKGLCVMHSCDNPACVNVKHLSLGTHSDNMQDMISKGRKPSRKGTNNGSSKLDWDKVRAIRAVDHYFGVGTALAKEYGVSGFVISGIRRNKLWIDT